MAWKLEEISEGEEEWVGREAKVKEVWVEIGGGGSGM